MGIRARELVFYFLSVGLVGYFLCLDSYRPSYFLSVKIMGGSAFFFVKVLLFSRRGTELRLQITSINFLAYLITLYCTFGLIFDVENI